MWVKAFPFDLHPSRPSVTRRGHGIMYRTHSSHQTHVLAGDDKRHDPTTQMTIREIKGAFTLGARTLVPEYDTCGH